MKRDYTDKITSKINSSTTSSKDWWKTLKSLINKSKHENLPPLNSNGRIINDPCDKANLFNTYFESQTQLNDHGKEVPHLDPPPHKFTNYYSTEHRRNNCYLEKSWNWEGLWPWCINNRVLKATAETIARPLTNLFNSSLRSSTVPDIWKKANVSPIHKKDDKTSVENYRPISLISLVGKTFEKAIFKHVHNFLLENRITTPLQSGLPMGTLQWTSS